MKRFYGVALLAGMLALSSCGREACDNLPVCLNPPPADTQPYGNVQGAQIVEIAPGQTRDVTVEIKRVAIPADEPVRFIAPDGTSAGVAVLARTPDGALTVTGSVEPFVGDSAVVRLSASASAATTGNGQTLSLRIRKQSATIPRDGEVVIPVLVR